MKYKVFKGVALLSLLVAAGAGCEKKREVSGQIFISTAGGESIKLGAVQVLLFPKEVMLRRKMNYAQTLETAEALHSKTIEALDKNTERVLKLKAYDGLSDVLQSNRLVLQSQALELCDSTEKMMKQIEEAYAGMFSLEGGRVVASTDADGSFQFTIEGTGDYSILASSSRKIMGGMEQYHWIANIGNDAKPRLILNNLNTVETEANWDEQQASIRRLRGVVEKERSLYNK